MFRVCPPYILFWRLKSARLSICQTGMARGPGQDRVQAGVPQSKGTSWYGAAAEQEDLVWGQRHFQLLTLSSYFPSSYYIDGRVAKVTDFLKTRLLDTLSDQIRKIQKVSKCRGSAGLRGHRGCSTWLGHSSWPGLSIHSSQGSWAGAGRERGPCAPRESAASPVQGRAETPGSTKPGPRVGCVLGCERSGRRLQHSMGCAGVLVHRAAEDTMQCKALLRQLLS